MKRMHEPIVVCIMAALLAAACSGAGNTSAPSPGQQEADRHQIEQDLFKKQEELDLNRFKLDQLEIRKADIKRQCEQPGGADCADGSSTSARGFFTKPVPGRASDLDEFMNPTTLAVISILLTLLATSLSLVRGN